MKKKNVINLIKYYSEHNDIGFRNEAYEIAKAFDLSGDYELSEYIMALLSDANTFRPQISDADSSFFRKADLSYEPLPLPETISEDIKGVINAIGHNVGVNKFLFQGFPGTGKTETAKQIAHVLQRELFIVDFSSVIDSKLGQTAKNVSLLFQEINSFVHPERMIVLFDELDALALDRTNSNDVREMGRATSAVLSGLDNLKENVVLIATTNLYGSFDKALSRRFDSIIDFNRYTREDLLDASETIMNKCFERFKFIARNMRLFRKTVNLLSEIPYPGEIKNIIKTSVAFSNLGDQYDYLKRLYRTVNPQSDMSIATLHNEGFTTREIEILTGVPKSTVSRELKG